MFDLNGEEFKSQSTLIFNNGEAGKVENVSISVEKKDAAAADNAPEYKVIFTDDSKASINMGIYYPTKNEMYDDTKNKSLVKLNVDKVLAIAKSVVGNDYIFTNSTKTDLYEMAKELIDSLMRVIATNCEGKKVNVFATYGSVAKPKSYLGIYKNFDFIEVFGANPSRLRVTKKGNQYDDMMERVLEDAPTTNNAEQQPTKQSWI